MCGAFSKEATRSPEFNISSSLILSKGKIRIGWKNRKSSNPFAESRHHFAQSGTCPDPGPLHPGGGRFEALQSAFGDPPRDGKMRLWIRDLCVDV